MVVAEKKSISREAIHRAIDELEAAELSELATFIEYLHFKTHKPQGSPWAKELYDLFAPVREAAAASEMTSDEIDKLLDEELDEVRRERNS